MAPVYWPQAQEAMTPASRPSCPSLFPQLGMTGVPRGCDAFTKSRPNAPVAGSRPASYVHRMDGPGGAIARRDGPGLPRMGSRRHPAGRACMGGQPSRTRIIGAAVAVGLVLPVAAAAAEAAARL